MKTIVKNQPSTKKKLSLLLLSMLIAFMALFALSSLSYADEARLTPVIAERDHAPNALPARQSVSPTLTLGDVSVQSGETVTVPLTFAANGHQIVSIGLSIDYDQNHLSFDDADADSDGVPDALTLNIPPIYSKAVSFNVNDADGELDVLVFYFGGDPENNVLPDGVIASIAFQAAQVTGEQTTEVSFSTQSPAPSFGNVNGVSVPGVTNNGSVLIQDDNTPPTGSILINNGDAETDHPLLNLTLNASDDSGQIAQMMLSDDGWLWEEDENGLLGHSDIISDPDAANGKARKASVGEGEKYMVYGPYTYDIPLNQPMRAVFRLKVADKAVPGALAWLDVSDYDNQSQVRKLANMELTGADFTASDHYQEYWLDFTYPYHNDTSLEFRVYFGNRTDVTFDRVQIFAIEPYASTKNWHLHGFNTGQRKVYAQYQDAAGNWSQRYDDTIDLICTPPVCNGNFEQDFYFWLNTDNATVVAGRSGQGAQVDYDGGNSDIHQLLPDTYEAGKTYRATAWCKADVGDECRIFFGDSDHNPNFYPPNYENQVNQSLPGNGQWQQLDVSITLSKNERMSVYVYAKTSGSSVIYDDVYVEEITYEAGQLVNGGFETGQPEPWQWYHTNPVITDVKRSGQYGLQISVREAYDSGSIGQTVDLPPGVTVYYKAHVKGSPNSTTSLKLYAHNDNNWGNMHDMYLYYIPRPDAWTELMLPYTADSSGKLRAAVTIRGHDAVYIDDLQLVTDSVRSYPAELVNGNFENGGGGWYLDGADVHTLDASSHSGSYALRSVQERTTAQEPTWRGIRQRVQVTPGQVYLFTAWLKWQNAAQAHIKIEFLDANDNRLDNETRFIMRGNDGDSNGWKQRVASVIIPEGAATAQIIIWHGVSNHTNVPGGTVWIDDVSFDLAPCVQQFCDGDIESGTVDSWDRYSVQAVISTVKYNGQYGVQLTANTDAKIGTMGQTVAGLTPGETVYINAQVKSASPVATSIRIYAHNGNQENYHFFQKYIPFSDTWTKLVLPFTVDDTGILRAGVQVWGNEPIYVDDIQISDAGVVTYPSALVNGDFEDGGGGWYARGMPSQTLDPASYSGAYAIRAEQTRPADKDPWWSGVDQRFQITPGQVYDYYVWLKWENAAQLHMKVKWYDANGDYINWDMVMPGTDGDSNGWKHKGGSVTAPSNAATAQIFVWHGVQNSINITGSTVWIDDVSFNQETSGNIAAALTLNGAAQASAHPQVRAGLDCSGQNAVTQMKITGAANLDTVSWEPYAVKKGFTLDDGQHILYAQCQDSAGITSDVVSATITVHNYGAPPRIKINNGVIFTGDPNVTLTPIGQSYASQMEIDNDAGLGNAVWETYAFTRTWTLNAAPGKTIASSVYVAFKDVYGQIVPGMSDDIFVDLAPPSGNASPLTRATATRGASNTGVILQLAASDDQGGSGVAGAWISANADMSNAVWSSFSSGDWTYNWTAGGERVYVQFQDNVGNKSDVISIDITGEEDHKIFLPLVIK